MNRTTPLLCVLLSAPLIMAGEPLTLSKAQFNQFTAENDMKWQPAFDAVLRVAKESPAVLRDLTPLHDATRVLVNPHKGWYHHFPDNHPYKYQIARETDLLDFPGMDHLYIRLAWSYLEPKEGQFDWAVIDRLIEKWTAHGLGIAFRISCKETSTDRIEQQFATPRWVMEAGAQGGYYRMGKAAGPDAPWEPVFDDPIFLAKLDKFLAAFAARYDAKPWLRYVDIGSIGDWGEGHCWAGSRKDLSFAVRKQHVELHLKHFKRSQLIISDDFVHALTNPADRQALHQHILANGISYRDDSIMVDGYFANSSDRFTVRSPEFFADAYLRRPTVFELEHYGKVKQLGNWEARPESAAGKFGKGKKGPDFFRGALELLHATYIGYHGDARLWLDDNPELSKELLNRCGYWLFPKSIGLPQTLVAGETVPLTLSMENRGVAPPYAPYELRVKLSRGGDRVVRLLATGCMSWLPGTPVSLRHQLPLPSDLKPGDYDVAIGLFDLTGGKERPVEFGLKASLRDPEGYYKLTSVPVKAIIGQNESSGAASGAKNSSGEDEGGMGVPSPNLASDAKSLPADPASAAVLWEIKVGTHQYSIPTLDRCRIYIGANDTSFERPGYKPTRGGALYCVEQATGKLIWQLASPRYFEGVKPPLHFDQWGCGICSGPVLDGNRVYVVGNRGEILCLDADGQANGNDGPFKDEQAYMGITNVPGNELRATDGDIIWKYNLLSELDVAPHDVCGSTLLLQGDYVYACTSNGLDDRHDQIPRPLAPSLIVLDKTTGRLVAADAEQIGQRLLHCHWSSPSAGRVNGQPLIFFGGGDGVLYAFQPPQASQHAAVQPLKKVWAYDCNPPEYRKRDGKLLPYSNHTRNSPEGPSEIIGIPVFYQGRVYASIGQSPVHGNGRGCLSCVDAATGAKVWSSELIERTLATAAIADGLLYIPDCTGNLHCFDAATGDRYWVHPLGAKTWGASAFVADDKVYMGTESNVLWVLQAGKTLRVLSKTRMQTVPITPIAAPGVLYIPTQNKLTAFTAKPGLPEGSSGPHQRP